eukprot:UN20728
MRYGDIIGSVFYSHMPSQRRLNNQGNGSNSAIPLTTFNDDNQNNIQQMQNMHQINMQPSSNLRNQMNESQMNGMNFQYGNNLNNDR